MALQVSRQCSDDNKSMMPTNDSVPMINILQEKSLERPVLSKLELPDKNDVNMNILNL